MGRGRKRAGGGGSSPGPDGRAVSRGLTGVAAGGQADPRGLRQGERGGQARGRGRGCRRPAWADVDRGGRCTALPGGRRGRAVSGGAGTGGGRVGLGCGGTGYRISGQVRRGLAGACPRPLAALAVYRTLVLTPLPRPSGGVVGALPRLRRQPAGPAVWAAVRPAGGWGSSRISS